MALIEINESQMGKNRVGSSGCVFCHVNLGDKVA